MDWREVLRWVTQVEVEWWALAVALIGAALSILSLWRSRPSKVHWSLGWTVTAGPTGIMLSVQNVGASTAHDVHLEWIRPRNAPGDALERWETIHYAEKVPFLGDHIETFRLERRMHVRLSWREAPATQRRRRKRSTFRLSGADRSLLDEPAEYLDVMMLENGMGSPYERKYRGAMGGK